MFDVIIMAYSSVQPRKQRRARENAPLHVRRKMMHLHASKELRAKLGTKRRALLVHKGDKVRLRKGDKAGHVGAVMEVDYVNLKVYVEGLTHKKARGTEKLRVIQPSNLEIVEGDFSGKDRAAMLARSKKN